MTCPVSPPILSHAYPSPRSKSPPPALFSKGKRPARRYPLAKITNFALAHMVEGEHRDENESLNAVPTSARRGRGKHQRGAHKLSPGREHAQGRLRSPIPLFSPPTRSFPRTSFSFRWPVTTTPARGGGKVRVVRRRAPAPTPPAPHPFPRASFSFRVPAAGRTALPPTSLSPTLTPSPPTSTASQPRTPRQRTVTFASPSRSPKLRHARRRPSATLHSPPPSPSPTRKLNSLRSPPAAPAPRRPRPSALASVPLRPSFLSGPTPAPAPDPTRKKHTKRELAELHWQVTVHRSLAWRVRGADGLDVSLGRGGLMIALDARKEEEHWTDALDEELARRMRARLRAQGCASGSIGAAEPGTLPLALAPAIQLSSLPSAASHLRSRVSAIVSPPKAQLRCPPGAVFEPSAGVRRSMTLPLDGPSYSDPRTCTALPAGVLPPRQLVAQIQLRRSQARAKALKKSHVRRAPPKRSGLCGAGENG